ncbi:MAG: sulfurtransferase complex subunit TusB [Gammaproteobacteria bacterium]|nr:sulfurtransferase complex subunit TusB [Gammaproteobacteria bacterium]MDH3466914.1 sulfurtransferase complex subunit TusB [Gammaproteobacteria bacterium]
MLHIVNKSPFEKNSLETAVRLSQPDSAILLIEDAVYAASGDTSAVTMLKDVLRDRQVFALGPDLQARGVDVEKVPDGIEIIDYEGFVDLVVAHESTQSWL